MKLIRFRPATDPPMPANHKAGDPATAPPEGGAVAAARQLAQSNVAITEADLDAWLAAEMLSILAHRDHHDHEYRCAAHEYSDAVTQIEQFSLVDAANQPN